MQVLIIPAWLRRKLEANNLPLTVVLDTERLSSILTKEDLFFLLKANWEGDEPSSLDYGAIKRDFSKYMFTEKLLQQFAPAELELLEVQYKEEGMGMLHLIYGDVLNQEAIENRALNLHNYETVMLQPEVCAVLVKPIKVDGPSVSSLQNFLEVLQGQMGYDKVAKLESFKRFVQKV